MKARQARRATPPGGGLTGGGVLWRDRWVQATGGLLVLSVLPSFAPVLPPDATFTWSDQYSDVPLLVMALAAMGARPGRAQERRERIFWWLLLAVPVTWLAVRSFYFLVPFERWGILLDQASDGSYLLGYLGVLMAIETRPHLRGAGGRDSRRVEATALMVFGYFLLAYFTLAPSVLHPELYATWVPSMFLFAALDVVLLIRLVPLLAEARETGWEGAYRWLAALLTLWLLGDLVEGLMYMEAIPFVEPGTPWDVIWASPPLLLVLAVRSRALAFPERPAYGDVSRSKYAPTEKPTGSTQ